MQKLEAVVDELQHVHVEIRTEHTRNLIEKRSYNKFIIAVMNQHIHLFWQQDFIISGIHSIMNH